MSLFSRRPRFQLSLRTALILFLLTSLMVGVVIRWRQRAVLQQEVIRVLMGQLWTNLSDRRDKLNVSSGSSQSVAICKYDYQLTDDPVQQRLFGPKPSWLSSIFGVDMVHSVKKFEFLERASGEHFRQINRLGYVTQLEIANGVVEPDDWADLCSISSLTTLTADATNSAGTVQTVNRFQHLANLARLKELHLIKPSLTEAEWISIFKHPSLKILSLKEFQQFAPGKPLDDQITRTITKLYLHDCFASESVIFELLKKLPQLDVLSIDHLAVSISLTDQVFESIASLKQLEQLFLHRTSIRGHKLHLLSKLPIKKMALGLSNLDDQGLDNLVELKQLEYLEVGSTKVTDRGMKALAQLPNLEYLSIRDTAVTDQGLLALSELKQLKRIRIRSTLITDGGVQMFRRELPDCSVDVR